MKTKNVILGVIGSMAVGAVLGVLFAPDKGINTRKKIAKKKSDLENDIKSKLDFLTSKFSKKAKETIEANQ